MSDLKKDEALMAILSYFDGSKKSAEIAVSAILDKYTRNNEWVSVEDNLPQVDFEVLVAVDDDVSTAIFRMDSDGEYWFEDVEKATHWMPLPNPPKAEK